MSGVADAPASVATARRDRLTFTPDFDDGSYASDGAARLVA